MEDRDHTLGIDFGTTNTVVFYWKNGKVERMQIDGEEMLLRSAVAYKTENDYYCGKSATQRAKSSPLFVRSVKRVLGRTTDFEEVENDIYGCQLQKGMNNSFIFVNPDLVDSFFKTPIQVTTDIFKYIKQVAEERAERVFTNVFLCYPSTFQVSQKAALRQAAKEAGFSTSGMITEPTAAGVHYKMKDCIKEKDIILMFDFGGGTLDLSLMVYEDNAFFTFASGGHPRLGGNDIDLQILRLVEKSYNFLRGEELFDLNERSYYRKRNKLLTEIEKCKIELQQPGVQSVEIELNDMEDTKIMLTEELFNREIDEMIETAMICLTRLGQQVLQKFSGTVIGRHKITNSSTILRSIVDSVILVGGSSKLKLVHQRLVDFFSSSKVHMHSDIQECVGSGAFYSFLSTLCSSQSIREVLYNPLVIRIDDAVYRIERGTTSPFEVVYAHKLNMDTPTIHIVIEEEIVNHFSIPMVVFDEEVDYREKLPNLASRIMGVHLAFGLDCVLHVSLQDYYSGDMCVLNTCNLSIVYNKHSNLS